MTEENKQFHISNLTIVRAILWVALALLVYYLRDTVLIVLTSVVIASAVQPISRWFINYKVPRVLAVLFVYVGLFALLAGAFYFIMPILVSEVSGVAKYLPTKINIPSSLESVAETVDYLSANFKGDFSVQSVVDSGSALSGKFFNFAGSVANGLFGLILIVVISFYLAVQEKGVENFLRIIMPLKYEAYAIDLWRRTEKKIGGWAQGQLVLAIIIGPFVYLGLSLMQIKYALVLAIIAMIFELIPIFGPILAAVPAVLLGFSQGLGLGLAVILFFVVIQQFENHLLYPLVVKKIIGVPPLVAIIALIVGAKLAGFLGIILSVPLAALMMEMLGDLEKRKSAQMHQTSA